LREILSKSNVRRGGHKETRTTEIFSIFCVRKTMQENKKLRDEKAMQYKETKMIAFKDRETGRDNGMVCSFF